MSMVRASGLSGYRELVEELGGNAATLLDRFRIPASVLDDPQAFVSYASLIRLLEWTAEELACPDFGLRLCTRQDLGILGPLGIAVRNCDNLGDAMRTASRYMYVHSPAISFFLELCERDQRVRLVYRILLDRVGRAVQVTELSVGLAARTLTMLAEKPQTIVGVRFSHPPMAPRSTYEHHFKAPIRFRCEESAIELELDALALPIHDASVQLRELAEDYLQLHHEDPSMPLSTRVRMIVQKSLGTGSTACIDVASALALHPRTLQRELRREGTTFEKLKDDTRAKLAQTYIGNRDLPLSQVAALLDYSEQSALSRSCRRWFGTSPRELRAQGPAEAIR